MRDTNEMILVEAIIEAPISLVWRLFTSPEHVVNWNHASDEWHTPSAKIDLRPGGKFLFRMEARDGSFGFDFSGVYEQILMHELVSYILDDQRKVTILFDRQGEKTKVTETFQAETENPIEMQKAGWQAILNNFKKYVESNEK